MSQHTNWKDVKREAPAWFRDAKFGLFFHWGPYSVPAFENEWYSRNMYAKGSSQNLYHIQKFGPLDKFGYKDFYDLFLGERFNPEDWAELVVRSGARYAGLVTEHSDNFSMWDSKVNQNNCMNYGMRRDATGELVDAFRKYNIKILATFHHQWLWGWFMSSDPDADVYVPDNEQYYWKALPLETNRYMPYRLPDEAFNVMWRDKVLEVIDHYCPDIVYFDSRSIIIGESFRHEIANYYYNKCSHINGIITYKQEDFPDGVGVLDIECGRFSTSKSFPWQTDNRLEDNITWCMVQEPKYKSAEKIIHQLCDVVAKNGNLLLNVGPYEDGSFHEEAKRILYEIGDWLKVNGDAIYGSRPWLIAAEGPTGVMDENYDVNRINNQLDNNGIASDIKLDAFTCRDFRFTQKDGRIFAIALGWPDDRQLAIRALRQSEKLTGIRSITLIGSDAPIVFRQSYESLVVDLPAQKPCKYAFALCIEPV